MNREEMIVLGGGCFWCIEAVFRQIKGVLRIESGYAGGHQDDAYYESVSAGGTDHAEVIKVVFDPQVITVKDILTIFFASHNPTTLNKQGNDIGTQYRSVIFYTTLEQKRVADEIIAEINQSSPHGDPVVTEVLPLQNFYSAEGYHQDYYAKNSEQAYCQLVINPKLEKIQKQFSDLLNTKE